MALGAGSWAGEGPSRSQAGGGGADLTQGPRPEASGLGPLRQTPAVSGLTSAARGAPSASPECGTPFGGVATFLISGMLAGPLPGPGHQFAFFFRVIGDTPPPPNLNHLASYPCPRGNFNEPSKLPSCL